MNATPARLTAADAALPTAVPAFQRIPEEPLPYPLWTRIGDWFAGLRDRVVLATQLDAIDTPWLHRLGQECRTRLEAERRGTLAITAVIDDALAAHRRLIANAVDEIARLEQQGGALAGRPLSDEAVTSAEQYDLPEHRRLRRARARQAEAGRLEARRHEVVAQKDQALVSIATLTASRQWHWTLLLVRSHHLVAHYNRRSASYVRTLTRRADRSYPQPTIAEPEWARQATAPELPPDAPTAIAA